MEIDINKETEWLGGKELNSVEEIMKKENNFGVDVDMENTPVEERFDNAQKLIKEGFMRKNYADSMSGLLHQPNTRLMHGTLTRSIRSGIYTGQFVCEIFIEGYHMGTAYDMNAKQAKLSAIEQAWNIILNEPGSQIIKRRHVDMELLPDMYPDAVVGGSIHKGKESNLPSIMNKRRPGEFKPVSSFIILSSKMGENNPTMVLRQSADFCGMLLEFDYKRTPLPEVGSTEEWVPITDCKVYLEGQYYGSGSGLKRNISKAVASKVVLDKLKKTNYTILVKREFNEQVLDRAFLFEDEDQNPQQSKKKNQEPSMAFKYGKGAALLQRMGWTGGGLGKEGNEGIMEPVSLKDIYGKEGLGFRSDLDVMKEFVPKMEQFLQRYVKENRMETLIITPKLNKAERTELFKISSRLGLKHQSKKCEKHAYILISHKMNCHDLLKYLVSIGGKNNMYELVDPELKRQKEREKLEKEREKLAMDAVKLCPRRQVFGFPQRVLIDKNDSKFPALKVEESEDDEEGKEEVKEKEVKKQEEKMEVDEGGGEEVDEKQQGSLSWFLGQFNIAVKEDKNKVKEKIKEVRRKYEEEVEREKRAEEEEEERLKREELEHEEEEKREEELQVEREKRRKERAAERERAEQEEREMWLQAEKEREEEERIAMEAMKAMQFDYTAPSTSTSTSKPQPAKKKKPAPPPKNKQVLDEATKEKLVAKNSLSFFLQQMVSGSNEQDDEEEVEEEEEDEEKEEETKEKENDIMEVENKSKDKPLYVEPKKKVAFPPPKPKKEILNETEEEKQERLMKKNSLSFFLQQMASGATGNEEEEEEEEEEEDQEEGNSDKSKGTQESNVSEKDTTKSSKNDGKDKQLHKSKKEETKSEEPQKKVPVAEDTESKKASQQQSGKLSSSLQRLEGGPNSDVEMVEDGNEEREIAEEDEIDESILEDKKQVGKSDEPAKSDEKKEVGKVKREAAKDVEQVTESSSSVSPQEVNKTECVKKELSEVKEITDISEISEAVDSKKGKQVAERVHPNEPLAKKQCTGAGVLEEGEEEEVSLPATSQKGETPAGKGKKVAAPKRMTRASLQKKK